MISTIMLDVEHLIVAVKAIKCSLSVSQFRHPGMSEADKKKLKEAEDGLYRLLGQVEVAIACKKASFTYDWHHYLIASCRVVLENIEGQKAAFSPGEIKRLTELRDRLFQYKKQEFRLTMGLQRVKCTGEN
jgi:hypothetical protein